VKGQKNEILTRKESRPAYRTGRHSCLPKVFYFLPTAHFLKQLPTHIAHIAKAPQLVPIHREANATNKALSKSAILPPHQRRIFELIIVN